ncbi:MAG: hypothetical protein C5B58_00900 [Acidobacteria bacterium]|nr:MAG: hypothetical protein C5B58_00900 [Acidobacteriota bacterium]
MEMMPQISNVLASRIVAGVFSAGLLWGQGGNAERGKLIFEGKGQCLSCHRVSGVGGRFGPDLSEAGSPRRNPRSDTSIPLQKSLELSIVDPDAEVLPENRFVRVVTKEGKSVTGRLLNQDNFTVQFRDGEDKLRSMLKKDLTEIIVITKSQMPSYKGTLSEEEIADLVAYLTSLK